MSHAKIRMNGVWLLLIGATLTAWTWWSALNRGSYYPLLAAASPAMVVVGLGQIVFPGDEAQASPEEGETPPGGDAASSGRSQLFMGAGIVIGLINWFLIARN